MKVLSARLAMKDGYSPDHFRHTIAEWLKAGPPSKEVGERYETEEISAKPTTLKAGYGYQESIGNEGKERGCQAQSNGCAE